MHSWLVEEQLASMNIYFDGSAAVHAASPDER